MRDFSGLLPPTELTTYLAFLRDRLKSSHRKVRVQTWIWDKQRVGGAGWHNLSDYGFEASVKYADIMSKAASTGSLSAVDPTKSEWNPFFGSKAYLLKRGNKVKITIQERDLPFADQIFIPLFTGYIQEANYTLDRSSKTSRWEVDLQVLNFQSVFKKTFTSRAFYPPINEDRKDCVVLSNAVEGEGTIYLAQDDVMRNYKNGQVVYMITDADYQNGVRQGKPEDRYVIEQTIPAQGFIRLVGKLRKFYPAGSWVVKVGAASQEECDLGYIARELLKDIGYVDAMHLTEEELKHDIPDTGVYIQNKFQTVGEELGVVLEKLLIAAGRMPWLRPYDGRIVAVDLETKIRVAMGGLPTALNKFRWRASISSAGIPDTPFTVAPGGTESASIVVPTLDPGARAFGSITLEPTPLTVGDSLIVVVNGHNFVDVILASDTDYSQLAARMANLITISSTLVYAEVGTGSPAAERTIYIRAIEPGLAGNSITYDSQPVGATIDTNLVLPDTPFFGGLEPETFSVWVNNTLYGQSSLSSIRTTLAQVATDLAAQINASGQTLVTAFSFGDTLSLTAASAAGTIIELSSDVIKSMNYSTDRSNAINQVKVVGLSPNTDYNLKPTKEIFSTNGTLGYWANSDAVDQLEGSKFKGLKYLKWSVFGSEDRKVRIRNWQIDKRPEVYKAPQGQMPWILWSDFAIIPHDEFECELRLYFDNKGLAMIATVMEILTFIAKVLAVIMFLDAIYTVFRIGPALTPIFGAGIVAGMDAVHDFLKEHSDKLVFFNMIFSITQSFLLMNSVTDYKVLIKGMPVETFFMEISATATMPGEILNDEGTKTETYEDHIISVLSVAARVAKLLLMIRRSDMSKANFQQIYDYMVEPGDVLSLEIEPDRFEHFLVRDINFSLERGESLLAKYTLSWLDSTIDIDEIISLTPPNVEIEMAGKYDDPADFLHSQGGVPRTKASFEDPAGGEQGDTDIPLFLNYTPGTPAPYGVFPNTAFRHELCRISITNDAAIRDTFAAQNKQFAYVYAYSTMKSDFDEGPNGATYKAGDNELLNGPAAVRAATPSPSVFTDVDAEGLKYGIGLQRKAGTVLGPQPQDALIGSMELVLDDDTKRPRPWDSNGVMFIENSVDLPVIADPTEALKRRFPVAVPLPNDGKDPGHRRIMVRVGVVELKEELDSLGAPVLKPIWTTLLLSNSMQIVVLGAGRGLV